MNDALLHAIQSLQWEIGTDAIELAGAASGAGVYRMQAAGEDAVLKVTGPGRTRQLARRELTFYRTMADRMPITTPRLLRYADDEDITALLLTAHQPSPPAPEWSRSTWLELARQLAALHSLPIPSENHWLGTSWLHEALDRPPLDAAEGYWSNTSAAASSSVLLRRTSELAEAFRATPDSLVHGDCHVDNLLREDHHRHGRASLSAADPDVSVRHQPVALRRDKMSGVDESVTDGVATTTRVAWTAAGALVVLVVMAAASIVSRIITHDTSKACSADGRICVTRQQAPRVLQVRPVDRIWVSVDVHDQCGTLYPTPFRLPEGPLDARFQSGSVELHGWADSRITYNAKGC